MSCNCDCHDNDSNYVERERWMLNHWFNKLLLIPSEIEWIKKQHALLAQDQYAKAHLGECMRLEDRITTALKEWEKMTDAFHERIKKLEEKK